MVNGVSLRNVFLHEIGLQIDPTVTELVLSKVHYDLLISVDIFSKVQGFSVTPSCVDGVPPLSYLQHFALSYATQDVYLYV